jgi:hypothetical protein
LRVTLTYTVSFSTKYGRQISAAMLARIAFRSILSVVFDGDRDVVTVGVERAIDEALSKRFLFSLQGSQFLADFGEPVGRPAVGLVLVLGHRAIP